MLCRLRHCLLDTDGEGGRRAAGNGEKRTDGQIEKTGKKVGVGTAHLAAQIKQTLAFADAERGNAQKRQTDAGNQKAKRRRNQLASCHLPHVDRENQISRAEKQPEKHARDNDVFLNRQLLFHNLLL